MNQKQNAAAEVSIRFYQLSVRSRLRRSGVIALTMLRPQGTRQVLDGIDQICDSPVTGRGDVATSSIR